MAYLDETGLAALWQDVKAVAGKLTGESDGTVRGSIAELTAKGHAEQDGTPTPESPVEIQVVRGRNLLDESKSVNGIIESGGNINSNDNCSVSDYIEVTPNTDYYMTNGIGTSSRRSAAVYSSSKTFLRQVALSGSGQKSGVLNTGDNAAYIRVAYYNVSSGIYQPPQLELGSTPQPYVPYGHVGMEVKSKKNLFGGLDMAKKIKSLAPNTVIDEIAKTVTFTASDVDSDVWFDDFEEGKNYTFILRGTGNKNVAVLYTNSNGITPELNAATVTDVTASRNVASFGGQWHSSSTTLYYDQCGIFEGVLTLDDFEPYYHSTTPIPLPQRGWVAGLPDGTADSLRLDGAGKCEWELTDAETTTAATDGVTGTIGVDVLSTTGQIADGVTVLYKLATPVTEDCGYCEDWPTDIPEGATVTIPELDEVGIRYFVDSAVTELAKQWYARANSEYADRLQALESAVAELVTGA